VVSGLIASACAYLRATPSPMPTAHLAGGDDSQACRLVLLPGRWDRPADFERRGFTAAVARRGLPVEIVAADAHLGYYLKGLFLDRLRMDVIQPGRDSGDPKPWLVGISLGGFGALAYARHHPDEVAGVVALAPYLGGRPVTDEIAAAGGLARWVPPEAIAGNDFQRDLWQWLKGYADRPSRMPPLVLGFGQDDRLAPAARLLAQVLPSGQVLEVPGGHDWRAWTALWNQILDAGPLADALRHGCDVRTPGPAPRTPSRGGSEP
jgi:pimeloyl-ACP methyl ester carboxylesterase